MEYSAIDYINELEKVGFTPQQAKVQAQALGRALAEKSATKTDLEILKGELTNRFLIILLSVIVGQTGLLITILKLFF